MNRKQFIYTVLIAFFIGAFGSIILGRFLFPLIGLARFATNSPIVINRREEVQLNEGVNLIDLIKQSGNFTVGIYGTKNNFLGNGTIVTSDGLVLTANSVIAGQTQVSVLTNDGKKFPAALKTKDTKNNLVLLKIDATNLPVVQFENAEDLKAGQRVIFLGRSNVNFEHKAVTGLVTQSLANQLTGKQIYTDAVIDIDYVGGPIVNLNGRVVGLTLSNGQNIIGEDLQTFLTNYLANTK